MSIDRDFEDLKKAILEAMEALDTATDESDNIEAGVADLRQEIDSLENTVEEQADRIKDLLLYISTIEAEVENLQFELKEYSDV